MSGTRAAVRGHERPPAYVQLSDIRHRRKVRSRAQPALRMPTDAAVWVWTQPAATRHLARVISDLDISIRLLVAAALGCLIGFERERLLWAAGIRTHMLVSVGAALLMIVSAYGFQHATTLPHVVLDPSRTAAQVVSGIGFLGAGSILLRGHVVRGLTTAASIWAVAAVGLAAGGGLFFAAAVSTAIMLVILAGVKPLEEAYRRRIRACVFLITAEPGVVTPETIKTLIGVRMSQVDRVFVRDAGDLQNATVHLMRVSDRDIRAGIARLRALPGVLEVDVKRNRTARRAED